MEVDLRDFAHGIELIFLKRKWHYQRRRWVAFLFSGFVSLLEGARRSEEVREGRQGRRRARRNEEGPGRGRQGRRSREKA
jgi:hypothetical protein